MKIIKELAEMIREELEDSECYAKCAIKQKDTDSRLADMFFSLSKQELDHSSMLHDQAVRLIKDSQEEASEAMKIVWEWEHDNMISKTEAINRLYAMYKS